MNRFILPIFSIAALFAVILFVQREPHASAPKKYVAPEFTLKDLEGQTHRLSDLRGKVVFLNLWTTWCWRCREEIPSIERLYRKLKDRKDFVLLSVSEDADGASAVKPFVRKHGITFPVLLDPRQTLQSRYGTTGFPETFLINKSGMVVRHYIGPAEWDSDPFVAVLLTLLGRPGAGPMAAAR